MDTITRTLNSQNDKRVNTDLAPWWAITAILGSTARFGSYTEAREFAGTAGDVDYAPRDEFTPARNSETNIILDYARDNYGSESGAWFAIGWLGAFQDFDEGRDLINEPLDPSSDAWELVALYEARETVDAETWDRHWHHAVRVLDKMFDVWNAAGEYNN